MDNNLFIALLVTSPASGPIEQAAINNAPFLVPPQPHTRGTRKRTVFVLVVVCVREIQEGRRGRSRFRAVGGGLKSSWPMSSCC